MGKWDWQVFLQDTGGGQTYLHWMMSAWGWTLSVAVLALIVALVVGSLMGILRTTPSKPLVFIGNAWTELFRNIPLLVQIFLWYHVIPSIFLSLRSVPSFVLVVFALGFFTSARIAEQVRAGIQSLPQGPALRRPRDGPDAAADLSLRAAADGVPHHHPAAHQRVDEHHQEHLGRVRRVSIAELTMFAMQAQEETSRGVEIYLAVTLPLLRLGVRGQPARRADRAARPGARPARREVTRP